MKCCSGGVESRTDTVEHRPVLLLLFAGCPTPEYPEARCYPLRNSRIVQDDGVRGTMAAQMLDEEPANFILNAGGIVFGPEDV